MSRALLLLSILFACVASVRADAPATEFFAIQTAKLAKLAAADADLDNLTSGQLEEASIAHGWYGGGLSMRFLTKTFRIDARFSGHADTKAAGPAEITYLVCASTNPNDWDLCSVNGSAGKIGRQFVTKNWRTEKVVIILRFLNLKH